MASRKEQKEQLRAEREARERAAQSDDRRKRMVGLAVAAVLVVAAVAAIVFLVTSGGDSSSGSGGSPEAGEVASPTNPPAPNPDLVANLTEAAKAADCELSSPPEEGNDHVPGNVEYKANPPTSGDHFEIPVEDSAFTEAPPIEQLVHSLEHGRIYIQFSPDVDETTKAQLQGLFEEDPYHVVLAPNNTDMPFEVAATAWNQALTCEQMNGGAFDAIRAFKEQYRDQGPEFVP